ncbi:DUF7093 family protein [Haloarchaeobius baliensis]|uniref:DUF7093 family protein n=1 Tax=Haloarchaeobius baliensis TaxID=1670458 RepID=UPI003F885167
MGLMCSLRGHDWSERELEDERDERGNEVVLTVREYEVCSRCDSRNLVSENTEVTSVAKAGGADDDEADEENEAEPAAAVAEQENEAEPDAATAEQAAEPAAPETGETVDESVADTADDGPVVEGDDAAIIVDAEESDAGAADATPDATPEPADATDATDATAPDPADEDAVVMTDDDEPTDSAVDAGADAGEPTADAPEASADPHEDPERDDGVILPGEGSEPSTGDERGHGEWPEHEQADAPEAGGSTDWPDHDADDGGYDAQVPDDEAADVEFGGGLAPEAETDAPAESETAAPEEGHDAEFVDNATGRAPEQTREEQSSRRQRDGESVTGIASASEVTAPSEGTNTSPDAQLVCPACGNAESRSRTSLRAGDICPECKRGYLAEADE